MVRTFRSNRLVISVGSSPLLNVDTVRAGRRTAVLLPVLGFTLIELLVVIAIIGILASIVLVSLNSARNKGKDTRVISDVNQVRTQIESEVSINGVFPASGTSCVTATDTINASSGNCNTLRADAVSTGGVITIKATVASGAYAAYAVYGRLVSDSTKYFCADSTGKVNSSASAATTVACP